MRVDPDACRDPDLLAAEVRRLRSVIDAEHAHGLTHDPVAWAVNHAHGTTVWCSEAEARRVADEWLASRLWVWAEVVPLYRSPSLTHDEREAIEWAISKTARTYDDHEGGPMKREALRGLLERTK